MATKGQAHHLAGQRAVDSGSRLQLQSLLDQHQVINAIVIIHQAVKQVEDVHGMGLMANPASIEFWPQTVNRTGGSCIWSCNIIS